MKKREEEERGWWDIIWIKRVSVWLVRKRGWDIRSRESERERWRGW